MQEHDQPRPPSLQELAGAFLKLGATAYGGLAMVEPIRRRVVEEHGWLSRTEFLDGLALCQLVPGATVVQLAAYIGYRLRHTAGALVAAAAFICPAFLLMLALSAAYFAYGDLPRVRSISTGLNAVVIALLLQALWGLGQNVKNRGADLAIALAALAALWLKANYFVVFLAAGLVRLVLELRLPSNETTAPVATTKAGPAFQRVAVQLVLVLGALFIIEAALRRLDPELGLMSYTLLKVATVAFGGGYAMIPVLQWDMVDLFHWLTVKQFLDGILLGFVTPGPIVITATFAGYGVKGLAGAAVATISIFLPPVLLIIFLSPFYHQLAGTRLMRPVIQGILAALVGMLALVTLQMGASALTGPASLAVMAAAGVALIVFRVNLLWIVAAVTCLSLLIF
jgi:chromate transporter